MAVTARIEDYLEAVFKIEISGRSATVTELAARLRVTKATVTAILKRMKDAALLDHERYGDVTLTDAGRERALAIYRRHEFLTDFFINVVGLSLEQAQAVSCVMEHEIDELTEIRLAAFTDAITKAEREEQPWFLDLRRKMEAPGSLPIPLCMEGHWTHGSVCRLTASGVLRKHLLDMGFVPGVEVERIVDASGGDFIAVRVQGADRSLGKNEAATVWIQERGKPAAKDKV